jgi:hypothetical protein
MNLQINPLSDPKVIGPGTWYVTHLKAYEAINNKKIDEFIDHMYMLAEKFACKKCRKHINTYIEDHPFEDLINLTNEEGRKIGMFKWAWLFHNAVNTRIGKPYVDWETAWEMYSNDDFGVCSKNCDEVKDVEEHEMEHQHIVEELPTDPMDRKSKLAQSYFMKIGIPTTLQKSGVYQEGDMVTPAY